MEIDNTKELRCLGERCYIQNCKGIVRYVGEVPPTEGIWYGVEWDKERGKNDGMIHGKRYFECRDKYGSFVRPHKISFGIDANAGFQNQYGNKVSADAIVLHARTNRETVIEMVGFDKLAKKQSNYESLREANLSDANISHAVHHGLEQLSPSLKTLNLSDNLLSSLRDVYEIAGNLKKLNVLHISENRISNWNTGDLDTMVAFTQLTTLYINKMQLKWHQLLDALKMVPNVKDVHACFNEIHDVRYDDVLENIVVLNLEGNMITEWTSVMQLSKLRSLQKLILNSNQINSVEISNDETEIPFKNLTSLSLSDNHINEWNSINMLNNLKSIRELRFRDNPISQGETAFDLRQELIARIETLEVLNGSMIEGKERKTAEMAYVKKYASDYYNARSGGTILNFNERHPKFLMLAEVHGLPEQQVDTKKSLKDNLIDLLIKCPDCNKKPDTQKKVPATLTLQQLKGILQRLYKIPTSKQKISYIDSKNLREIPLEDNMKQLCFYSIASGDSILLRW